VGQKIHPIGFRTGVTEPWKSRWYAPKAAFGTFLVEDEKIRQFVDRELNDKPPFAGVSKVEIERTRDEVRVKLHTARPGVVIGAKGAEVEKLRERVEDLIQRRVNLSINEVKNPDIDARLIAMAVGEQLKKRASFRRLMKQRCEAAMSAGAKGVKIMCSGRLANAELARTETQKLGAIPLQTLQANVDYAVVHTITKVGTIGVKVWVFKGMYGEEEAAPARGRSFARRARRDRREPGPIGGSVSPPAAPGPQVRRRRRRAAGQGEDRWPGQCRSASSGASSRKVACAATRRAATG
jgi:small subunit ribosomal protein S3